MASHPKGRCVKSFLAMRRTLVMTISINYLWEYHSSGVSWGFISQLWKSREIDRGPLFRVARGMIGFVFPRGLKTSSSRCELAIYLIVNIPDRSQWPQSSSFLRQLECNRFQCCTPGGSTQSKVINKRSSEDQVM